METDFISKIIIIVLALLASAFFSGMEIAFLSSNKLKLELDKKENSLFSSIAELFSKHPAEYMTTILIGNNVALVIYSLTMSVVINALLYRYTQHTMIFETIFSTIIIIFIAEFMPKSVVKTNPNFYYRNFSFPVFVFYLIFYPISKITTTISKGVMKMIGIKSSTTIIKTVFDKGDLANLVEDISSSANESANEGDKDMKIFQNALDFSDLRVRDCMIRRVEIEAMDVESSLDDVKKRLIETKFSRLPIYEESIDKIIGYINIKDFFKKSKPLKEMVIDALFVPETMAAQKLLATFIKNKSSLAIVLDEFGGTAGMITIEDILEEIFGEIEDEHDLATLIERELKNNEYLFSGRIEVDHINEKYHLSIPEDEEYDTIAGYIIFKNEGLPKQGDIIEIDKYNFHILKMGSSKIDLIKIAPKSDKKQ